MTVGIDINIDPSGAVSGGRVATASLDDIEKAADASTASVDGLNTEMSATPASAKQMSAALNTSTAAVNQNTAALNNTAPAAQQMTTAVLAGSAAAESLSDEATGAAAALTKTNAVMGQTRASAQALDKSVNSSSATMKKFNGFVGQAGFQVSDMAIQLGMGANAAMVFGIQGGQLLGFLNPLAGAIATVSGILIGQFTGGMYSGAEATQTLTERTRELSDEYVKLTKNQALFLSAELTETLSDQEKQAELTRAKIETYQSQLARFPSSAKAEEWNTALVEQKANLDTVESEIEKTTNTLNIYSKVVEGQGIASDSAARQIKALAEEIQVSELALKGYNREAVVQAALNRLATDATAEQRKEVELLAGKNYDLAQSITATNTAVKEFDQDGAYLAKLEQQVGLVGENARKQAMLRAEYSLSEQATKEQKEQAQQLAGALYDATEAKRQQIQQEREAKREAEQATQFSMGIVGDATGLEALEQKRQIILAYQEQEIGDAQAHAAALVSLERQTLAERASITSSGLGSILALQSAYGDDSSGIYRTLLTVQKAATLYSVLLSSQEAIGKAWASAAPPYNLPAVALAVTETGALSATVQALTPSFATGGLAFGPGTGTSDSFTANLSNGEFVMPQRETARNLGTLQAMRAGVDVNSKGAPNIQIVNQTTGKIDSASASWVDADTVRVLIREEVPGIVSAEFNDEYSNTNKAVQSQYTMQRKF